MRGSAIASKNGDCGPPSSIYKGQKPDRAAKTWESKVAREESNPYQNEWNDLVDAIRNDKPFNEAELRQRVDTLLAVREILRQRYSKELHQPGLNGPVAMLSQRDQMFVGRVEKTLSLHFSDPDFSTSEFASGVAMSERQLQRKLKALMNHTPREYLRNYRLQEGAKMLRAGASVADAAYSVGFLSLSYFAKCFKAQFGVTPSDVLDSRDPERSVNA